MAVEIFTITNLITRRVIFTMQDLIDKNILKEIGEKRGRKYELV